jgi:hypothetical protein
VLEIEGAPTLDEVRGLMDASGRIAETYGKHFVMIDARKGARPAVSTRAQSAEAVKTFQAKHGDKVPATAMVFSSSFVAGAMTALRWLTPPKNPERHFTTLHTAFTWLESCAILEKLSFPPAARALIDQLEPPR